MLSDSLICALPNPRGGRFYYFHPAGEEAGVQRVLDLCPRSHSHLSRNCLTKPEDTKVARPFLTLEWLPTSSVAPLAPLGVPDPPHRPSTALET